MLEHGAYNLLLDYYYAEEHPIPLDLDEVYRLVRAIMPEERAAVVRVLTRYFTKTEDGYRSTRADEEIAKGLTAIEQMSEAGKRGAEIRWANRGANGVEHGEANAGSIRVLMQPPTTNHQPPATTHQPPVKAESAILPTNIPYKEIVGLFNEHMKGLPSVRDLTKKRRDLIRVAWQASKRRQSLEFWKRYFEECAEDAFLNGSGPYRPPHETWRPTFDFLLRSDQVTKVYERAMHEASQ